MIELNKIHQGDCLERLKEVDDNSVDLIVIDPPYNIGIDDWDKIDNYLEWVEDVCMQLKRVLKNNGGLYIWGSMKYIAEIKCIYSKNDFILNSWCVWNKLSKQQNSTRSYVDILEHCLYFTFQEETGAKVVSNDLSLFKPIRDYFRLERHKTKLSYKKINEECFGTASNGGGMASNILTSYKNGWTFPTKEKYEALQKIGICEKSYNELKNEYDILKEKYECLKYTFNHIEIGEKRNPDDKRNFTKNVTNPINVWEHQNTHELNKLKHLTPKPLILIKKIIKASSNKGDIVLDCFMGSGTLAVACKELGRNFIGIEKEHKYIDIANKRLSELNKTLDDYSHLN